MIPGGKQWPAYYNEIDPVAAQWLRNLIAAGHIAPGYVDERSIEDVKPSDLEGFTQCHFFAGIGIWSYALRRAGWPDSRRVWTGSCPCQPFSAAGKGGGFADERHLWPAWFHLITTAKEPEVPVFGEQVASKDGLAWLDLVSTDLEAAGHACWPFDLCAAGVGAPHIRQRLWFVAERLGDTGGEGLAERIGDGRVQRETLEAFQGKTAECRGDACRVADAGCERRQQNARGPFGDEATHGATGRDRGEKDRNHFAPSHGEVHESGQPGPTNGHWRDADWLFCRDGKFRPVEPGTFPLVDGAAARVGRLRAYGNGIVAAQAAEFIKVAMEVDESGT